MSFNSVSKFIPHPEQISIQQLQNEIKYLNNQISALQKENISLKNVNNRQNRELANKRKQINRLKKDNGRSMYSKVIPCKPNKNINPRNNVKQHQSNITSEITKHENRLNEWKSYTDILNKEFSKINNNNSQKNVNEILNSYINCIHLLNEQQSRSEDIAEYIISLNLSKKELTNSVKKCDIHASKKKDRADKLLISYQNIKQLRESLENEIDILVNKVNSQIQDENKLNKQRCNALNQFNVSNLEKDKFECLLNKANLLRNKYAQFEEDVDNKTDEINKYFSEMWSNHERIWMKWNANDIICWIKYLIYNNKINLSNNVKNNLDNIQNEMIIQKINGDSLKLMDKSDIKSLGFQQFNDYKCIHQQITELITKYPDSEYERYNVLTPGAANNRKIPTEYSCPISGEIMLDPVIAYDNKTYERNNIIKYLQNYGKAPGCKYEYDRNNDILIKNKKLKQRISTFLAVNPHLYG